MELQNILTGPFNVNTWIIPLVKNKILVIDPAACKFTRDSNKITDFLTQNNLEPVAFILTHGHFDHITGCQILKEKYPKIPLVCSKADSIMIGKNAFDIQSESLEYMGLKSISQALKNLPDADILIEKENNLLEILLNFENENLISDNELKNELKNWKIIFTPGHTPGSICLYNSIKNILISGDTVFYHSYGRTDLPGGSEIEMTKSLNRLIKELPGQTKVYPGHDAFGFLLGDNF